MERAVSTQTREEGGMEREVSSELLCYIPSVGYTEKRGPEDGRDFTKDIEPAKTIYSLAHLFPAPAWCLALCWVWKPKTRGLHLPSSLSWWFIIQGVLH